jgi:two-component system chemotaxis response regulator CheY
MRVLVIDDSRAMQAILSKIMSEVGFDVITASNGREALEQLEQNRDIDLALVDWNLPEMNGYELVCEVRSRATFDDVKLIMVTTETEHENVTKALEAGADEYVMKPFTKATIVEKLGLLGMDLGME